MPCKRPNRTKLGDPIGRDDRVIRDHLESCDKKWAEFLAGQRYESVKLKASYTYRPELFSSHAREI